MERDRASGVHRYHEYRDSHCFRLIARRGVVEGRCGGRANGYGHMLAASYAERFQFFATLMLPDVGRAVDKVLYSLDTLKAAPMTLQANSHGMCVWSEGLDPLMEVLNEREATAFIHPNRLNVTPVRNDIGEPEFVLDVLLDTTRAASDILMMNVPKRYTNIKFLLAHSGGFLPFAAYRVAATVTLMTKESLESVLKQLRSFYVDTALSSTLSAVPSTFLFVPDDQIVYGSDYSLSYLLHPLDRRRPPEIPRAKFFISHQHGEQKGWANPSKGKRDRNQSTISAQESEVKQKFYFGNSENLLEKRWEQRGEEHQSRSLVIRVQLVEFFPADLNVNMASLTP